jgi:hypothetical protein
VDFELSYPRLPGFCCNSEGKVIEAVVVVVALFPPHPRPQITLPALGQESRSTGTTIPACAGIRLPGVATSLLTGPWRTVRGLKTRELEIKGSDGGVPIDGVVALSDLPKEIQSLNADCGQK